ncbi:excinuclease ABC subunit UvrA, partial [Myxococcota bacterium]|nr:excinuclease ABC subunit UvrA [Myxococcota bacterium]
IWPGLFSRYTRHGACEVCQGEGETVPGECCAACGGGGFSELARSFTIAENDIVSIMDLTIEQLSGLIQGLPEANRGLAQAVLEPLLKRCERLISLGMGDLTLGREGKTLSRGEIQLLRIAALESGSLTSVIVVLDEPSQGLTSAERPMVLSLLEDLKRRGDTVLVVEHDPSFLKAADHIVELGPGAGVQGGHVVFSGTYEEMLVSGESPTGMFLTGGARFPLPRERSTPSLQFGFARMDFRSFHATGVAFPYQRWSVISGPMGSGKSSLLSALYAAMTGEILPGLTVGSSRGRELFPGSVNHAQFDGLLAAANSHVASYMGVFSHIRNLMAELPLAKVRGYKAQRFSTQSRGGRCEHCMGRGVTTMDLGPLTQMAVPCTRCEGARYTTEVLEIRYRGKNISEILLLSVDEAAVFFVNHPKIAMRLALLQEIGLGYLLLGQAVSTLSGGESQRMKLGRDLTKTRLQPSLYLLDEPVTGLHMRDVVLLGELFMRLVDEGHTVVTVDHSGMLGGMADACIELGDGSGPKGGRIRNTRGGVIGIQAD